MRSGDGAAGVDRPARLEFVGAEFASAAELNGHVLIPYGGTREPLAPQDLAPGGSCPFLAQEAWVSAEGRFDPCCAPDAQRRTLGEFGSLHAQGLMEIWGGNAYRQLTRTYRTRALCLGCNMRRPVEGT